MKEFFPAIVMRALELAAHWHEGQVRKHPFELIPYIAHPAGVGFLLQKAGYEDDVVAAGILHDVLEDCGVKENELAAATSARIARLVSEVTEPVIQEWKAKKQGFLVKLSTASDEALAIKCADHIYNLYSIIGASKASTDVWELFGAGREDKLVYEQSIYELVRSRVKPKLARSHAKILAEVKRLI
ncbi:MAG: HD domain-containing protein [Patescibacteria group bacterium]